MAANVHLDREQCPAERICIGILPDPSTRWRRIWSLFPLSNQSISPYSSTIALVTSHEKFKGIECCRTIGSVSCCWGKPPNGTWLRWWWNDNFMLRSKISPVLFVVRGGCLCYVLSWTTQKAVSLKHAKLWYLNTWLNFISKSQTKQENKGIPNTGKLENVYIFFGEESILIDFFAISVQFSWKLCQLNTNMNCWRSSNVFQSIFIYQNIYGVFSLPLKNIFIHL